MASIVISSSSAITLAGGTAHYVAPDVQVLVTAGDAVGFTSDDNSVLYNDGIIVSLADEGVAFSSGSGGHSLVNGESGIIRGTDSGILMFTVANALSTITNLGSIYGGQEGIFMSGAAVGATFELYNSGAIFGADAGVETSQTASISNSGSIQSNEYGITLRVEAPNSAVVNSGLISGTTAAIRAQGANAVITNTGLIEGATGIAYSGTGYLYNFGTITGGLNGNPAADAVTLASGDDTVLNRGFINGDVSLDAGADTFRGIGGTVNGTIDGGDGDDIFYIDQADAQIDGGSGTDTLYARADVLNTTGVEVIELLGADDLTAFGDDLANDITGNGGANELHGGIGNDTILGGAGDDAIYGESQSDLLAGGLGDDLLHGGSFADTLVGNNGADTLYGGTGSDRLIGGLGRDVYAYDDIDEIGALADGDRIVFAQGDDLVDLSGINDEAFIFIGSAAFSGSGAMELRAISTASGNAVAMFDENGDGAEDGRLVLLSTATLTVDDFIL